jgi:Tol biopolymer transport system component
LRLLCQDVAYLPFSWSPDSKRIVYTSSNGMMTLCQLEGGKTFLSAGRYPLCNPMTGDIYYVGPDTHLYKTRHNGEKQFMVDNGDWSWKILIDIAKDGKRLFFIGGGSRFLFLSEYATIGVFDLVSHKEKILSKKYAIIKGASLF